MNIAIVESPSIHFIKTLSEEMERRGNKAFSVIHDLKLRKWAEKVGLRHYPNRLQDIRKYDPAKCSLTEEQINDIIKFEYRKNKKLRRRLVDRARVLHQYFQEFYQENKIELVFILNDTALIQGAAKYAAKDGPKILYWENGFFPGTLQIDQRGVNCNNSLSTKKREFFEKIEVDNKRYARFLEEYKISKSAYLSFPLEDLEPLNFMERIYYEVYTRSFFYRRTNPESAHESIFSIFQSIYRLIYRKFLWKEDKINLPDKFVFIPLQVRHDTQVLVNSRGIGSMERLVDLCYDAVKNAAPGYRIVVKEHPHEVGSTDYRSLRKRYPDIIWLKKFDLKRTLEKASLVMTLNSTVGIEALIYHKPVITLGEHFCGVDEIMYNVKDTGRLEDCIRKVLSTSVNNELIDKFLYYLRFEYLVEGDWKGRGIENVVDRIEER